MVVSLAILWRLETKSRRNLHKCRKERSVLTLQSYHEAPCNHEKGSRQFSHQGMNHIEGQVSTCQSARLRPVRGHGHSFARPPSPCQPGPPCHQSKVLNLAISGSCSSPRERVLLQEPYFGKPRERWRASQNKDGQAMTKPPPPLHILRLNKAQVSALSFSDDNERLYTGDQQGCVALVSTRTMRPIASWCAHTDALLGVEEWGQCIVTHIILFLD
jgi:WD40 repeat protein